MPSPLVVVIVVVTAQGTTGDATTLGRAAQDALGRDAVVVTREEESLDDAGATRLGDELHADTLVVVTFGDAGARLRLYTPRTHAWSDRSVPFEPGDPPKERGRAVGFDIASMVRIDAQRPTDVPADAPPAPPPPPPPPDARPSPRFDLGANVQGAAALGDAGSSVGGEAAVGWRFTRSLAARARGGMRAGGLAIGGASATYARLGVGVAWVPLEVRSAAIAVGARADVLALRQSATRSDGPSSAALWTPAADVVIEATWSPIRRLEVVLGVGGELTFGDARIVVDGRETGAIAPGRILLEGGARMTFE